MNREISPPPLKRRKVTSGEAERPSASTSGPAADMGLKTKRHISVFSWNINGIQPFLPPAIAPITSYFKPAESQKRKADASEHQHQQQQQQGGFSNPLRAFLKRHHWPEVLFLQEVKISPSDKTMPASLLSTVNTSLDKADVLRSQTRYTVDVNLPRDKFNARGFGGKVHGVGTLICEDFGREYVSCIRHANWDLEGRVTIVELSQHSESEQQAQQQRLEEGTASPPRPPLALVNVYAVNGTTNPYRSPDTGQVTGTRHDHKLAFHRHLRDECLALEKRGFDVVIAGDLNIARGALDGWPKLRTYPRQHCLNRADFNALFFGAEDNARAEAYHLPLLPPSSRPERESGHHDGQQDTTQRQEQQQVDGFFDGVDVFRVLHGKKRKFTYHPRNGEAWGSSCDRVDLIVASRSLHDTGGLVATDILDSPVERGTSDHVPLWVRILLW